MKRAHSGYLNKKRRDILERTLVLVVFFVIASFVIFASEKVSADNHQAYLPSYGAQASTQPTSQEENQPIRQSSVPANSQIDTYKGVPVYSNGDNYMSSHGLNFSEDGYYFGYKWQCVEYVKRFYYEQYQHKMLDGAGHAKYFFDPALEQGAFNEQRGLYQYHNGGDTAPQEDDLLVFTKGAYGHVAIVSAVSEGWIEVIQQNSEVTRERYVLSISSDGTHTIAGAEVPAGWLRK